MGKKFIFVVGGVMSSVGKGVTAASIGTLLQARGYKVANMKADMYVNLDAGTIRPAEHGEVFVGEDGIEADQDLGNYERFTGQITTKNNYITTGQAYHEVIKRERNLEYNGEDVEVYPDVPKEIIRRINLCQQENDADITIVEFGGTVGEYQVLLFLEAARMMKVAAPQDVFFVLVSYLPTPKHIGEQKSKPTQYAIRTLNAAGIAPDFILCRADKEVSPGIRKTISNVCSLPPERIISGPDVNSIYDVPINFAQQDFDLTLLKTMGLEPKENNLYPWEELSQKIANLNEQVTIGIVGKYFNDKSCRDTYISVIEAINHAAWFNNKNPKILWLNSENYEQDPTKLEELNTVDAVLVPGGFGERGTTGIMQALRYAREKQIPALGICYGMQLMCVEFARSVLGKQEANSVEISPVTPDPIITVNALQAQKIRDKDYGATNRLGSYACTLREGTKTFRAYEKENISERHRHRYEFNNDYKEAVEKAGLQIVGINEEQDLVEIVELRNHPYYIGVQFHPEFKSHPLNPHPLFRDLVKAALERKQLGCKLVK